MLHTPIMDTGRRGMCVPTSIAVVTGLPLSHVRAAIREVMGHPKAANGRAMPILGVAIEDAIAAMDTLGWINLGPTNFTPRDKGVMRLGEFFELYGHDGPWLVRVGGKTNAHMIAVSHGEVSDTMAGSLPMDISDYRRVGQHVKAAYRFIRKGSM